VTRPAYIVALDVALAVRVQEDHDTLELLNRVEVDNADFLAELEDLRTKRAAARQALDEVKEGYRMMGYPVPLLPVALADWEKELLRSSEPASNQPDRSKK
jgi:hypothetical protein